MSSTWAWVAAPVLTHRSRGLLIWVAGCTSHARALHCKCAIWGQRLGEAPELARTEDAVGRCGQQRGGGGEPIGRRQVPGLQLAGALGNDALDEIVGGDGSAGRQQCRGGDLRCMCGEPTLLICCYHE